MSLDEAKEHIYAKVYDAAKLLETLENANMCYGNGHHARQRLAAAAATEVENRWRVEGKPQPQRGLSAEAAKIHADRFGPVNITRLTTKLAEEVGEFCGAVVRDEEQRDGRSWLPEAVYELRDVLTVLHVIANRLGIELDAVSHDSVRFFQSRGPMLNITKCGNESTEGQQ